MDLKDATLMILTESGAHPFLGDMINEASGKGVLRTLHQKYSAAACDAMRMPILEEIGRHKPVPPRRRPVPSDSSPDPLTADISYIR
jgi:hypothetical protein